MLQGDVPSGHEQRAPYPTCCQALTLWPKEDPVAGLVAVRLSIMLCRAERGVCHLGWGARERPVPRTCHPGLSPSTHNTPTPPPGCRGCFCQPCPALLQRQGLPHQHSTAQPCPMASHMHAAQALRARASLPRHGPPGSVSCCSAHSVGRDGASPSPVKSPSQLQWGQGGRVMLYVHTC